MRWTKTCFFQILGSGLSGFVALKNAINSVMKEAHITVTRPQALTSQGM